LFSQYLLILIIIMIINIDHQLNLVDMISREYKKERGFICIGHWVPHHGCYR